MAKSNKRNADRLGRQCARDHVRGRIYGRINVGLCEAEWRYVVELAEGCGSSMSDVIRWAIEAARKTVEAEVFGDGSQPPWGEEMALTKRFSHVEVTDDE